MASSLGSRRPLQHDEEKREWIIHSPTLTSPSGGPEMGKTATHAVVMARLITPRPRIAGPHAFVVQIRRNEDQRRTMLVRHRGRHRTQDGVQRGG